MKKVSKQALDPRTLRRFRTSATRGLVTIGGAELIAMLDEIETARLAAQERARP